MIEIADGLWVAPEMVQAVVIHSNRVWVYLPSDQLAVPMNRKADLREVAEAVLEKLNPPAPERIPGRYPYRSQS